MNRYIETAHRILSETGKPMSAQEIVDEALRRGFLLTTGNTPRRTLESTISRDIIQFEGNSLFMRTGRGRFGLRDWQNKYPEYIAKRFKKSVCDEDIIVISASDLYDYIPKAGLNTHNISVSELLNGSFSMKRSLAEDTVTVIQIVSFYIIRYENTYLTYRRAKRLPESRLHGFYSIGFGGHLNPDDIPWLFIDAASEQSLLFILRELSEELILPEKPIIQFHGLLYDTSKEVSKQHLGMVYNVTLSSPQYRIGERGFLMDSKFETLQEILDRSSEFENWSLLIAEEEAQRQLSDSGGGVD